MLQVARGEVSKEYRRPARLAVVEHGAKAFDASLLRQPFEETVIVAQHRDEVAAELSQRVISRIAAIERSHSIGVAFLVMTPGTDRQRMANRELLVRALLTHSCTAAITSEIVLIADWAADGRSRQRLMSLIETLIGDSAEHSASIVLRFGAESEPRARTVEPSGFHTRPAPRAEQSGFLRASAARRR